MSKKPQLAMVQLPSIEDLCQLFKLMTGSDPTPEDVEKMRAMYEMQHDEALDDLLIVPGQDDE